MITVMIDKINYSVSMEGHAGYAKHGEDIVCAATSILYYTFAQTLEDNSDKLIDFKVSERKRVDIKAVPQEGYAQIINMAFEVFETGIKLLHKHYPENVLLIAKG